MLLITLKTIDEHVLDTHAGKQWNRACFKKCKQLFGYQHLLLPIDIW
jgi:hypothetical protein